MLLNEMCKLLIRYSVRYFGVLTPNQVQGLLSFAKNKIQHLLL